MAKKARKGRGKVHTTWDFPLGFTTFTSPRDGYGLPSQLTATATDDPELPGVTVTVEIEIAGAPTRARARSVLVETARPSGVGWTTLANVPVRNIVGTAVLASLWRTAPGDEAGTFRYIPLSETDVDANEVREIVQGVVSYGPDADRFDVDPFVPVAS